MLARPWLMIWLRPAMQTRSLDVPSGVVAEMMCSETYTCFAHACECKPEDCNPLNCVYEIVADLGHRLRAGRAGGWVDMAQVVSMAGHKALAKGIVFEAIDIWECLGVLGCNLERNMVRFLVPPLLRQRSQTSRWKHRTLEVSLWALLLLCDLSRHRSKLWLIV